MYLFLYNTIFTLALPVLLVRLMMRSRSAPAYRHRILERFGFSSVAHRECLWVHTVSVGEFLAAVPMLRRIQATYPELPLLITTMTPTGSDQVRKVFGESVSHCYLPYDYPWAQKRLIKQANPKALVILETELWPNLLRQANACHVPVVLANARLSEKSARGYQRFRRLAEPTLRYLNTIAVQAQADADRFQQLGFPRERMEVTGSIKFDISVTEEQRAKALQCRQSWGINRQIIMAASTHDGEDAIVLDAYKRIKEQIPESLLVIVPRHPERFENVAKQIEDAGWYLQRRSKGETPASDDVQVILGDTMGELMTMLGASDVAFVGGTLVANGGHNVLEPIAFEVPVVVGPSMFNFQTIFDELDSVDGIRTIHNEQELAEGWAQLLNDAECRGNQIKAASGFMQKNQGALERLLSIIRSYL